MKNDELKIRYPVGFEDSVHITKNELQQQICLMAALKMFELGKISSGRAAELAGMTRVEFFETCARFHVSAFNYAPDEIEDELSNELETVKKLFAQ